MFLNTYIILNSNNFLFVTECVFGKQVMELHSQWIPDLGAPTGVLYCTKCECIPVSTSHVKSQTHQSFRVYILLRSRLPQSYTNYVSRLSEPTANFYFSPADQFFALVKLLIMGLAVYIFFVLSTGILKPTGFYCVLRTFRKRF